MSRKSVERRKQAKDILNNLFKSQKNVWLIHYSCESFFNRQDGSSSRITSIAVKNLDSGQAKSFSIHQVAEIKQVAFDNIEEHYNELEKEMLDDFFNFLKLNENGTFWLHWNMRDVNYGFQSIEHRYKVLQGENIVSIRDDAKIDLSKILVDIYGETYISDPKLTKLLAKNEIFPLNFLGGDKEAEAFERKDYTALHRSTLRKVEVLDTILRRTYENKLKTNTSWFSYHFSSIWALMEWLKEQPLIVVGSVIFNIVQLIIQLFF